jgi:trigger factor
MKVTQEKLDRSRIGLEIEVPGETSKDYYERAINKVSRTVNIPGFRKGKVPRQVIMQRVGAEYVKGVAIEQILRETFDKAVKQEDINAIGNFQVLSEFEDLIAVFQPGQPITYKASVDVPPEPKMGDYKGLSIRAEEIVFDPEMVETFIKQRREEKANTIPVSGRPVQLEDIAVVDYSGKLPDGTEIDGAQATDSEIEVSVERFIADLVHGIVGMNVGDTKEIPVQFPKDYGYEPLAGKDATFTVTVKDLKEKELPELTDEFVREISEDETVAAFRERLETQFRERAQEQTDNNIQSAILTALAETIEVDFPETQIEDAVVKSLQRMMMQFEQYGMDVNRIMTKEMIPRLKEQVRPESIESLKQDLAVAEISKIEKIVPSDEEVANKFAELLAQFVSQGQKVDETRLREYVIADLTTDKTIEFLKESAKIELVPEGTLNPPAPVDAAESEAEELAAE